MTPESIARAEQILTNIRDGKISASLSGLEYYQEEVNYLRSKVNAKQI